MLDLPSNRIALCVATDTAEVHNLWMPGASPPDDPQAHLARIHALWLELRQERDPQRRRLLEELTRQESDAYARTFGHPPAPEKSLGENESPTRS